MTATPVVIVTPIAPTPTPTAVVAVISFGHDVSDSSGVQLLNVDSSFELGDNIAWKVTMPSASAVKTVEVAVIDAATGATVASGTFEPDDIHFGQQTDLVSDPGTYVMRIYSDNAVVAEGQFTVTEPAATATEAPDDECDPSYPTLCLRSSPDLDCGDINARDFPVRGNDPHRFDGDDDGVGCESAGGGGNGPQPTKKPSGGGGGGGGGGGNCDPSYPTLCLPSSPDLDCGDINAKNFPVRGNDPHRFDGDNDGVGCES